MNNEEYLVLSYFAVGAACVLLALATHALLRRSLAGIGGAIPGRLGLVFRRLFFVGILLPATCGFLSVTFRSCGKDTYEKIVADRSYLVAKNQEQLKSTLTYVSVALLAWGVLMAAGLATIGQKAKGDARLRP